MTPEEIKMVRKGLGLSQANLAYQLSVRRQTISDWERGINTPHRIFIQRLREIFTTTATEGLSRQDERAQRMDSPPLERSYTDLHLKE